TQNPPIGDFPSGYFTDAEALWNKNGLDWSDESNGLALRDSQTQTIGTTEFYAYANNGLTGTCTSDLPADVDIRASTIWFVDDVANDSIDWKFDLSDFGASSIEVPGIDADQYKLLKRTNPSGNFTVVSHCESVSNGEITFYQYPVEGDAYYTIGRGNEVATVTTTSASLITFNSASTGGNVTADGGGTVTTRGVCWNTSGTPTTSDFTTTDGTGTGEFVSSLTGLLSETQYYVRAYAVNSEGVAYGNEVEFTTLEFPPTCTLLELPIKYDLVSNNFNDIAVGLLSFPTVTDIDRDGLLDLLIGDYQGYIHHYEQESEHSTSFTLATSNFNGIDVGSSSTPALTDLDGDGILDLLIGEQQGYIHHYEQESEYSNSFTLVTSDFNGIDVGARSTPTFTDLEGDGLLDLLIGEYDGNINHFIQANENSTSFTLATSNFNGIDVGLRSTPTFTDLEGDGLLDLLIGEYDGNINHFIQANENSTSFTLATSNFNGIDVGLRSTPTFTDLEGDGLLDLLIGEYDGNINHFIQANENSTSFTLVTHTFDEIDVGTRSTPTFTDLDGDDLPDLLIGEGDGNINYYEQAEVSEFDFGDLIVNDSDTRKYFLSAKYLRENMNIACTGEGFSISLSESYGYSQNINISPSDGAVSETIYVKFEPPSVGQQTGNIAHSSTEMTTQNILLNGAGIPFDDTTGTALDFDGSDDYVDTILNDLSGSEITIEYWFKGSDNHSAVRQQSGSNYVVAGWNDLHILSNDGGTGNGITVGSGAEDGNWHHIAMTWKQNTTNGFVSYLDGEIVGNRTSGNNPIPEIGANVLLGSKNGTGEFMTGSLDEVRIWNIARSHTEIRENMYLSMMGIENGLVSYWQFNEGTGDYAYDPVGDNNSILIDMTEEDWIDSTIPFGSGFANSQIVSATGNVIFTDTDVTMDFTAKTGIDTFVVTKIESVPNIEPDTDDHICDSQYWVLNKFGSGTFTADLNFDISDDLTRDYAIYAINPEWIKLYERAGNSDDAWAFHSAASSFDPLTNEATFSGISELSQFIVTRQIPQPDKFVGIALAFDGDNDYVDIPDNSSFNSNSFTTEFWMKPDTLQIQSCIIKKNPGGGEKYWRIFMAWTNGTIEFDALPGEIANCAAANVAQAGEWIHIAAVYDHSAEAVRIYADGDLKSEVTGITDMGGASDKGFYFSVDGSTLEGSLDEVRYWNIALTGEQIRENMYLPLTGSETGLVSYWQYNDGTGTTLVDNISGIDGTLINKDEEDWIDSTLPFGEGTSDSQTETAGIVDFIDTGLSMYFNSHNSAEITVTRIDTTANINPTEPDEVFDEQYWVVNRFGSGSFDVDLTFTISEDLTIEDESNPSQIALFTRSSNADTDWIYLTDASSVSSANDEATFDGITGFSQFIVTRWIQSLDAPQNVIVSVADDSIYISWDAVEGANSYKIYASDDPYAADWGTEIATVSGTSWNGAISEDKKFYRVVASTDVIRDSDLEKKTIRISKRKPHSEVSTKEIHPTKIRRVLKK
nr:VCBS repeat-containing protein [Candidatus Cloacimonadota bacterium]